jgi:hypothetical protein
MLTGKITELAGVTWETPNGLRTFAMVDLDGQVHKVWGEPIEIQGLAVGDSVHLTLVNDHYRIVHPSDQPLPGPTSDRPDIANHIKTCATLYASCYQAAIGALPEGTPHETIQACTSSVFISVSRKFAL